MKAALLCCAVALVLGIPLHQGATSVSPAVAAWGDTNAGLRLAISSVTIAAHPTDHPQFYVAIENVGDSDVVVNLGSMIANGKVMFPEAVRLFLSDGRKAIGEFRYVDRRYPGVEGRIDDFIVALRAGSVYTIRVSQDRWNLALVPGRYRIEARFEGRGAQFVNLDTPGIALLNFWKGTLRSNSLAFEVP